MSKNGKLLIMLTAAALLIVVYFILSSHSFNPKPAAETIEPKTPATQPAADTSVDQAELEANYKKETKVILNEFEKTAGIDSTAESTVPADDQVIAAQDKDAGSNEKKDEISRLRDQLMNITVPGQFKNLHLNLVLAFEQMEEFFASNKVEERNSSLKLISQAKTTYDWLN